jgi:hypothetical protein
MIVVSSFAIFSAACTPDSTSPVGDLRDFAPAQVKSPDAQSQYAWMGQFHNEALDFALVKIRASNARGKLDRCKVGIAAIKEFRKQFKKAGGGNLKVDPSLIDGMCEAAEESGFAPVASRAASFAFQNAISPTASNFMSQIVAAGDNSISLPSYSFAVNQIEVNASRTLGDGSLETGAVYGTGSIGLSSADYWSANESSWSSGSQQPTARIDAPSTGPRFQGLSARGRKILRADVIAAIGVLVNDWFLGSAALEMACYKAAAASLIAAISIT